MPETARPEPSRLYRWAVLIFISLAMGGNYYIYDSINPLERIFIDKLGYSATAFGWLNSSYSVAAVATLLIGGIIIDRIGTKKAITFFAVLCLLGAALTAARGQVAVMIAGRTILGLGAESMIVAVTTALAKWFKGKELSFAFGINLTIARLASVAADNSPYVGKQGVLSPWARWRTELARTVIRRCRRRGAGRGLLGHLLVSGEPGGGALRTRTSRFD